MKDSAIQIHEHLIAVLKERFKAEFGVAVEDASDSTFTDQKIDLFKQRVYLIGDIAIKDGIKPDSIKKKFKRALVFDEGSIGGVTIGQYDEVCYFLLFKKLEECNKDYANGRIVRTVRSLDSSRRIGKKLNNISSSDSTDKSEALNIKIEGIIHFNAGFWNDLQVIDTIKQIDLISRYYTHIDTNQISKAVASEQFIVEPQEMFYVTDSEKNKEQKTFNQVLEQANSEIFSLIKILGEGGIGKSTFLYWIGKNYSLSYNIFLVKRIYSNTADLLLNAWLKISKLNSNSIICLLDDIAEYEKARQVFDFIVKIKEGLSSGFQIIFIVAERKARYNSQIGQRKLDIHFSGSVQLIDYAPADKKEIFLRIYSILSGSNAQLDNDILKQEAESIFLDKTILSVSESIFKLLLFLKYKSNITYEFDWDDWDRFIKENSEYQSIENLFIAVTCFYQFGIMMPITFQCSSLRGSNRVKIRKALNCFGIEASPIRLTEDNKEDDTKLFLKHEYVATWFLYDESRKSLVKDFFKDFLSSINTKEAGWLLRQFRKLLKSSEFISSGFSDCLNEDKYLSLIENYIEVPTIPELEKVKMKMEKGIILLQKGDDKSAKNIFQSIADSDLSNNHARDQLARIYLKSPDTFQLAFEKYLEILKNGGLYAIVRIYKVLRLSKQYDITINYESNSDFTAENISTFADRLTSYEYHEAIKEFIVNNELDLAEGLLQKIEKPKNITAECYNLIASAITYSNENIEKKERLFRKSIEIDKSINPDEEDFQYTIDYAVFLYRIRRFPDSLQIIKAFTAEIDENLKEYIESIYWNNVRNTKKLFFKDMPAKENVYELRRFLLKQTKEAAALVSLKQKNIDNIIKGYLILQTVKYHSKIPLPEVFNNASKLMAYCYMQNADKKWNNLPVTENRLIAEKLYDRLLNANYFLDKNDCAYLLKNLLNFKEKEKSEKACNLANIFLENSENKKYSIFYRYRGNSKKNLNNFNGAMVDYQTALERCKPYYYENDKDYKNEKSYLLNNIALLICDCVEIGKPFKRYNLQNALDYCNNSIELRPDLRPFKETKTRIEDLIQKGYQ